MSNENRFGRHEEFIKPLEQEKISNAKILIAGCGAGSSLAQNLARLGFCDMTFADPDSVESHNLNRQDFTEADIGKNKAAALADRMHSINGAIRTTVIPERVTSVNAETLVDNADVIVDMIDVAAVGDMLSLHKEAKKKRKPVITGFDIGETAISYVFDYRDPDSMTVNRFLGLPEDISEDTLDDLPSLAISAQFILGAVEAPFATEEEVKRYYNAFFEDKMGELAASIPEDFQPVVNKLLSGKLTYIPQINTAAAGLGIIHSAIIKEIVAGRSVKVAPNAVRLNIPDLIK